jgi:hypothetical protein
VWACASNGLRLCADRVSCNESESSSSSPSPFSSSSPFFFSHYRLLVYTAEAGNTGVKDQQCIDMDANDVDQRTSLDPMIRIRLDKEKQFGWMDGRVEWPGSNGPIG